MKQTMLGRSGIMVPPLIFGGNVFGWTVDETSSFRLLDALMDVGFNAIDTADIYGNWVESNPEGISETIIGKWLKSGGRRDKVVIATKVGMRMRSGGKGLSRAWIEHSVEASLRRLQCDYIDLYQAHCDDEETPLEETLTAFAPLIEQGKVRAIGASNHSAPRLREALETSRALGLPRYEVLQPHYNLIDRSQFEGELQALCREQELGVISYFALAAGFLTGKYRSPGDLGDSKRGSRIATYLTPRNLDILATLDAAAASVGATNAETAIAWLIAQPGITAPIASATTIEQVQELRRAVELVLDRDKLKRLDSVGRQDFPAP